MTRSRKKNPVHGHTTATSEKADKQRAHGSDRVSARAAIKTGDAENAPQLHPRSGGYDFAKDGKAWVRNPDDRTLRK